MSNPPPPESPFPFEHPVPVALATWRAAVEAGLKGGSFEGRYAPELAPGVRGHVLSSLEDARDPGLPGLAPYLRGTRSAAGWGTALPASHGVPGMAARLVDDAAGGATAAFLVPSGAPLDSPGEVLEGVPVGLGVYLAPGVLSPEAVALAMVEAGRPLLSLGLDPVALAAMGSGTASDSPAWVAAEEALEAAEQTSSAALRPLGVDTGWAHGAGADDVFDLALLVASGVEQLRRLTAGGRTVRQVTARQTFHLNLGTEFLVGIARLRALRLLWARVCEACGDTEAAGQLHVVAGLGARHLTVADPHVNMLRNTAACFAAALGGADLVLSQPWDTFLGTEDPTARRVARNTPQMLALESGLDQVVDPMGGSWTIERLTADLAAAAWTRFQELEARGGVAAALDAGFVAEQVDAAWARTEAALDTRKRPLTGVSEFAILGDPLPAAPPPGIGDFPLRRLSAGFEALRDRADAQEAATGRRPRVFLANLGPIAEHTGRATWITNVLAAGGIEALGNDGFDTPAGVAEAFAASGASHACLCGSDARYAELAPAVARSLVEAGAEGLLLAGRPGSQEDAWRGAGIGHFVFLGADIRGLLGALLEELDPGPTGSSYEDDPTEAILPAGGEA